MKETEHKCSSYMVEIEDGTCKFVYLIKEELIGDTADTIFVDL